MFSALWNAMVQIYASLALLPFVSFFIIWGVAYAIKKEKKRSMQIAIDITTFLLVGVVSAGFDNLFPNFIGGFWLIALFLLLLAGLIGNAQNRLRGEIDGRKLLRAVWRIAFVGLSLAYVLIMLIGIIKYFIAG